MKKLVLSGLALAGALLVSTETGYAHGGQYRGPGDVVPPNPGGGGGRTPRPTGPKTPGPAGPATPGPAGPATPGPAGPATGGPAGPAAGNAPRTGGIVLGDDLTRWQFWWEFNKDPYINLKEAIQAPGTTTGSDDFFLGASKRVESKDSLAPSPTQIRNVILPALNRALDSTDQRDITSSCLVAMAKIGKDTDQIKILDLMKARLTSNDQEIRETAALAMGISQRPEALPMLVELVKDTPEGRKLCDRAEVDFRTRSFAAYGLGQIAYATQDVDLKRTCFDALKEVLDDKAADNRNIRVAVLNAMRLVRPNIDGDEKEAKLLTDIITTLDEFYSKDLGKGDQLIQAHVPAAIAQILGREGGNEDIEKLRTKYKDVWFDELTKGRSRDNTIYQSAPLALGLVAKPVEESKDDAKYSKALVNYYENGKDAQARYFSIMGLAMIGGNENRNELMTIARKGKKALERPWAYVALGVLAFKRAEADDSAGVDVEMGNLLLEQFADQKNPDAKAACAIGLGLAKYQDAIDPLIEELVENRHQDDYAGYLCIGLALMDAQTALEEIKNTVNFAVRRPELLKQAAIGLGKLGDKSVATQLLELLEEGDTNLAKMSAIATALGFIGDARTVDPLIDLLQNTQLTDLSRAFAAVALGGVADKEPLPWNSKIAVDMNYRASVETLTNSQNGILDIL